MDAGGFEHGVVPFCHSDGSKQLGMFFRISMLAPAKLHVIRASAMHNLRNSAVAISLLREVRSTSLWREAREACLYVCTYSIYIKQFYIYRYIQLLLYECIYIYTYTYTFTYIKQTYINKYVCEAVCSVNPDLSGLNMFSDLPFEVMLCWIFHWCPATTSAID